MLPLPQFWNSYISDFLYPLHIRLILFNILNSITSISYFLLKTYMYNDYIAWVNLKDGKVFESECLWTVFFLSLYSLWAEDGTTELGLKGHILSIIHNNVTYISRYTQYFIMFKNLHLSLNIFQCIFLHQYIVMMTKEWDFRCMF